MLGASGVIDAGVMLGVRKVNNLIDSALSAGQENPITAWQDLIFDDATGEYLGTVDKNSEYYYDSVASSERCTKYLQDIEDGKLPFEVKKKLTADEANDVWKKKAMEIRPIVRIMLFMRRFCRKIKSLLD